MWVFLKRSSDSLRDRCAIGNLDRVQPMTAMGPCTFLEGQECLTLCLIVSAYIDSRLERPSTLLSNVSSEIESRNLVICNGKEE